jgi:hypothetical protein
LNAFLYSNDWPVYVHVRGLERITDESLIFMGFRGDTAGVHRSLITPQLFNIYNNYQNTVLFMPASYIKLDNGLLQSVCHRRHYNIKQLYISNDWPSMVNGGSWTVYSKVMNSHAHIYMFSYSNGGSARNEYLRTDPQLPTNVSISNAIEFLDEYSRKTEFRSDRIRLIDGLIDIESNYGGPPVWNIGKFLKEQVENNPHKMYYSACSIESAGTYSHILLINALKMIGMELENGVIRYQNDMRNIIMDIIPLGPGYTHGYINLETQTNFLKDRRVHVRYHASHYQILSYATDQFMRLAETRGILKP